MGRFYGDDENDLAKAAYDQCDLWPKDFRIIRED